MLANTCVLNTKDVLLKYGREVDISGNPATSCFAVEENKIFFKVIPKSALKQFEKIILFVHSKF